MQSLCNREFGCHSCVNALLKLHREIKKTLEEPAVNLEKIRERLLQIKETIENIVG